MVYFFSTTTKRKGAYSPGAVGAVPAGGCRCVTRSRRSISPTGPATGAGGTSAQARWVSFKIIRWVSQSPDRIFSFESVCCIFSRKLLVPHLYPRMSLSPLPRRSEHTPPPPPNTKPPGFIFGSRFQGIQGGLILGGGAL